MIFDRDAGEIYFWGSPSGLHVQAHSGFCWFSCAATAPHTEEEVPDAEIAGSCPCTAIRVGLWVVFLLSSVQSERPAVV